MIKREDSVRSMGTASIGTDIPTREKLKKAAADAGMPLSEYIRVLANIDNPVLQTNTEIKNKTSDMKKLARAVFLVFFKGNSMSKKELEEVKNSALNCLTDDEIVKTLKGIQGAYSNNNKSQIKRIGEKFEA